MLNETKKQEKTKMKSKKSNARETLNIEIAAWSLIIGVIYIVTKVFS